MRSLYCLRTGSGFSSFCAYFRFFSVFACTLPDTKQEPYKFVYLPFPVFHPHEPVLVHLRSHSPRRWGKPIFQDSFVLFFMDGACMRMFSGIRRPSENATTKCSNSLFSIYKNSIFLRCHIHGPWALLRFVTHAFLASPSISSVFHHDVFFADHLHYVLFVLPCSGSIFL